MSGDDNFLDKFGFEIKQADVEVGKTYPLYGAITKIIDESQENFTIEINNQIELKCTISTDFPKYLEMVKRRAFEPAVFVAEITSKDPLQGHCSTIVFGRTQTPEQV